MTVTDDVAVEEFAASVIVTTSHTVLVLRGEIDCLSAPYLIGLMDAAIIAGHIDLVLDLGALDFIDASGLRVIANIADRLEMLGGTLAIRSPSDLVLRMLNITGMAELSLPDPRNAIYAS